MCDFTVNQVSKTSVGDKTYQKVINIENAFTYYV